MWIAIDHPAEAEQAFLSVPLPQGMLVIGRGKECDLIIHDHSLAKIHIRLQRKGPRGNFQRFVPTRRCLVEWLSTK
jgi:hypothetical protein